MKHLLGLFAFAALWTIAPQAFAQSNNKLATVSIQTSAQCGMCEEAITEALAFMKGIKDVKVDLKTKIVTVGYQPKKTNPEQIREVIAKTGYDADDVLAIPTAYEKLPSCCKKGGGH